MWIRVKRFRNCRLVLCRRASASALVWRSWEHMMRALNSCKASTTTRWSQIYYYKAFDARGVVSFGQSCRHGESPLLNILAWWVLYTHDITRCPRHNCIRALPKMLCKMQRGGPHGVTTIYWLAHISPECFQSIVICCGLTLWGW